MVVFKLSIVNVAKADETELTELVEEYLFYLFMNGQIWIKKPVLAWVKDDILEGYISSGWENSTDVSFHSESGLKRYKKIGEMAGASPKWDVIEAKDIENPSIADEKYLYIFTHAFDDTSPLCAGSDGRSLPLYNLGLGDELVNDLMFWMQQYINLDRIWFASEVLENEAYKELSGTEGAFFDGIMQLRKDVEDKIGKPVYYYLMNFYERENAHLCPVCGEGWEIFNTKSQTNPPFNEFNYECDHCRLVSHVASENG